MDTAPTIAIRDSRPDDADAIQRIYAHHVLSGAASFEEVPPGVDEILSRRQAVLDAKAPYIVAEIGGEVLGFAYAAKFRQRSAFRYTLEDSIYVEPESTGRGVGTRLLSELVERCAALGYRQMVAVISGAGNGRSLSLHKRLGFVQAGRLPNAGFKHGRWVDAIIMQRALGDGPDTPPTT
ncbi:MAG: N-acetyltransferase [Alphaproteobacteria bacterium]|nr:N-acetyltransferase [Alphaproteobacteria bacterium]MBF0249755.1 N-acetyltransferase [Alphaproteobacteria bacterium]